MQELTVGKLGSPNVDFIATIIGAKITALEIYDADIFEQVPICLVQMQVLALPVLSSI